MLPNDYNRRLLQQHNPHTSPRSKAARITSPSKSPSKPLAGGDRYIPQRQPISNDDLADGGGEWTTRYAAISPAAHVHRMAMSMSAGKTGTNSHGGNQSASRRLFGGNSSAAPTPNFLAPRRQPVVRPPTLDAGQPAPTLSHSRTNHQSSSSAQTVGDMDLTTREHIIAHRALLANELLGAQIEDLNAHTAQTNAAVVSGAVQQPYGATIDGTTATTHGRNMITMPTPATSHGGLFTYRTQRTPTKENQQHLPFGSSTRLTQSESRGRQRHGSGQSTNSLPPPGHVDAPIVEGLPHTHGAPHARRALQYDTRFSITPLSETSQRLLKSPRKPPRKINKNPFKVLDAPDLQDDFYLNLVDWSSQNTLAVGLGHCVYLWNAQNSQVVKLCDLSSEGGEDTVSSVQWTEKGDRLAVGTNRGLLQVWDTATSQRLHSVEGHALRVGCVAWNGDVVCTGSRDRSIIQRDMRINPNNPTRKLTSHKQEVCGLKWSPDHQYLASGGNDNQLLIWSLHRDRPVQTYTQHVAAVKALAWCPHQHGLLVSGGGTADRCLRFWNTLTNQAMHCIDTGSQVCNVVWSKHTKELVSTHGYSQNQIVVWSYPTLQQVAVLKGHSSRVLYLATSPDGESIVTGAGDETLRFWHVFNKNDVLKEERSQLSFYTAVR